MGGSKTLELHVEEVEGCRANRKGAAVRVK